MLAIAKQRFIIRKKIKQGEYVSGMDYARKHKG